MARRVAQLDAEVISPRVAGKSCIDIAQFITVLARVTDTGTPSDVYALPCLSPAEADRFLEKSQLLARLADTVPEIVQGPLRFNSQYWVGTGKPSSVLQGKPTLKKSAFRGVSDGVSLEPSTKPFGVGLFTSTGVLDTYGMWRIYLELNKGSTLHPRPWRTWAVEPNQQAIVHEIKSAVQWVEFVLSYPRRVGELLFPDWELAARHCDAVHMTLRAIVATQGLYFSTEPGIVAAPYWDVESTLWLRWCFGEARLVEVVT